MIQVTYKLQEKTKEEYLSVKCKGIKKSNGSKRI